MPTLFQLLAAVAHARSAKSIFVDKAFRCISAVVDTFYNLAIQWKGITECIIVCVLIKTTSEMCIKFPNAARRGSANGSIVEWCSF